MKEGTKNTLMESLSVCGDLMNVAHRIAADTAINEATRKDILNSATDFVNYVHAAIQEQLNYTPSDI